MLKSATLGLAGFLEVVTGPRTLAALRLSFLTALIAAVVNAVFGVIIAWVLIRYRFPGRRLLDAFVDLPFALPTAVAGIALTALYAPNGWMGSWLEPLGIKVAYTPIGITVALVFIGLPFVVRTVQPVLEEFDRELEEASATLGASRSQTVFMVMLPTLMPAILTGFALAFARAVGEYGSVIFIAGNMPFEIRDRAAAHHHSPRGVQLRAGRCYRHGDAADLFRHPDVRASGAGLEPQEIRPMTDAAIAPLLVADPRPRPSPPSAAGPVCPDRRRCHLPRRVPVFAARFCVRRGVQCRARGLFGRDHRA